jgi:lipopolysaccharide/colanic/teichoic acid biosynthesis glycosyltransferase
VKWAVDLYTSEERLLLSVRPGITDFASLRFRNEAEILQGSADPDRDYLEKIAPLKIRLGLHYVRTQSLATDLKIIVATALSLAGVDPAWCLPRGKLSS